MIKHNFKVLILLIILTLVILASSVGIYAAYNFFARDIKYVKTDGTEISVETALNKLYTSRTNISEFKTGITTINKGNNKIQVGFIPKYITAILETDDETAPANVNFFIIRN